jgi:acetoin utilization protein AcuB
MIKKLKVKEVMKKRFLSIKENDSISSVLKKFKNNINILTVLDKKGNFLGEIHKIDLLKLTINPKDVGEEDIIKFGFGVDFGWFAKKAGDIMNRHELTIEPDMPIEKAAILMLREDIRSLPVMKNNKIIGIITENKILKELIKRGK